MHLVSPSPAFNAMAAASMDLGVSFCQGDRHEMLPCRPMRGCQPWRIGLRQLWKRRASRTSWPRLTHMEDFMRKTHEEMLSCEAAYPYGQLKSSQAVSQQA